MIRLSGSVAAGARAAAPLALAVGAFAVFLGVLARAAGLGAVAPLVMSATTFAGSAQFAATSVLADGGGFLAATAAAVLLNARYIAIGVSVAQAIRGPAPLRFLRAQVVVDESWAVAHVGGGRYDGGRLVGAGVVLYAAWVAGTAIGVVGASELGDPRALGLDAAFPALFLALLAPRLGQRRARLVALIGAGVALGLSPVAPAGVPLVAAAGAALLGWRR